MEKLSYFGENSVQKGQNSVFQKNQKREKRGKCPKIKPAFTFSHKAGGFSPSFARLLEALAKNGHT